MLLFSHCDTKKLAEQTGVKVDDLYSYSPCFEMVFRNFENQINKNTYTYIFGYKFCQESKYIFTKKDFDDLGIKFNKSTEIELNKFYEYTGVYKKYIYKIKRENSSIIIFGGGSVGASGKYSDYIEWLIIDLKSGKILKNTQSSLSKYPFVLFIDNNNKINFIDYDYSRAYDGFINVREGKAPIILQLDSYILKENNFIKLSSKEDKFYCNDCKFYANDIIWDTPQ